MANGSQELTELGIEPAMSWDAIAASMGVSRKTVTDIYRDALDKLYIAFYELGIKPEDFEDE